MEKEMIIEVSNLSKIVRGNWRLRKIDLDIYKNDVIALFGRSGSGKELLTQLIANIEKPSAGSISYFFDEQNVLEVFGFQNANKGWPVGFKAIDVIRLYQSIYGVYDEAWINELLFTFDITQILNKDLNSCDPLKVLIFSIFLTFLHKPKVVVLDDISSQLALDLKINIMDFLKKYIEKFSATFIIISPDEYVYNELTNRTIAIENGSIVYDSNRTEIDERLGYEAVMTQIIDNIQKRQISKSSDVVIKSFVDQLEVNSDNFVEASNKFIDYFRDEEKHELKKIHNLVIDLYDIHLFISYVRAELVKFALSDFNKDDIISMKNKANKLKKMVFSLNEHFQNLIYNKSLRENPYFEALKRETNNYYKYLTKKLAAVFHDKKIISEGNELVAKLTNAELKKLNAMKKKMIKEQLHKITLTTKMNKKRIKKSDGEINV